VELTGRRGAAQSPVHRAPGPYGEVLVGSEGGGHEEKGRHEGTDEDPAAETLLHFNLGPVNGMVPPASPVRHGPPRRVSVQESHRSSLISFSLQARARSLQVETGNFAGPMKTSAKALTRRRRAPRPRISPWRWLSGWFLGSRGPG